MARRVAHDSLEQLCAAKEIVVSTGSGGVGKTTTAAALGVAAATHTAVKVLVLTVDPARRLASALGMEQFGNVETRVHDDSFQGELWAAMLDTKQSWDDLIRLHAPDASTRYEILANPLYQNITGKFVQSHDYVAMERLYEIHQSGRYDLIVVDTPPTRNAVDFLDAPERMADFFSSRLLRWLIAPYRSRVVSLASKPFYSIADRVLGTQFLEDIAQFFILFQSMYDGFVERARSVTDLLGSDRTTFLVVSTLEAAPAREAEFFLDLLEQRRYHVGALILNKVLPQYLLDPDASDAAGILANRADELELGIEHSGHVLAEIGRSFLDYQVVARREAEQRAILAGIPDLMLSVPYFSEDIHSLDGLVALGGDDLAMSYIEPDYDGPDEDGEDDGDFTAEHVGLVVPPVAIEPSRHLRRLVAGWDMLADLSFSDLLLYVPLPVQEDGRNRFLVVNQVRPNTGQTLFLDDVVGRSMDSAQRPVVAEAARSGRIAETEIDSAWLGSQIRVTAIPVRFQGRTIAVVARESARSMTRQRAELEGVYLEVFDRLARMLAAGEFPFADEEVVATGGPRVGDGVVLLDEKGRIAFTSPNAISALRRIGVTGRLQGALLGELGAESDATYRAFFTARPANEEVERDDSSIVLRCIPLIDSGRVDGAVVLIRDISELRSRDRMLVSKDATIREIHHRVKNNLQTISSLLRLQGRRLSEPSAKAAIEESVRRIRSIALVHETLSREAGDEVDFGTIVRPLVRMVEEGLTSPERPVHFSINSTIARLPSPAATSLAVVLTELLQNVVDHAYPPGTLAAHEQAEVRVDVSQAAGSLRVVLSDDGVGIGRGFDFDATSSLGMSIVRGLVEELGATISFDSVEGGTGRPGTRVSLSVPVVRPPEPNATRPPSGGGRSVGR